MWRARNDLVKGLAVKTYGAIGFVARPTARRHMTSAPTGASPGRTAPAIRLTGLRKEFTGKPPVVAVDDANLSIGSGEFFSMLGPSGSGKTTVLRMIAGFEEPTTGTIELAGEDVTGRPPYARDVNTVFQDYAIFPHMNVQQNVEYGLLVKKVGKAERRKRAQEALEQVRLGNLGDRRPTQLSGGQRQRVALARALVNRAEGAAARRAAGCARPEAARTDAGRAQGDPARRRHHLPLRHATTRRRRSP